MRNKQIAKIRERIKNHVRSRYERIIVQPQVGRFNFRCFDNVIEEHRHNDSFDVYEVIYIDNGYPILHYINYDTKNKRYLETTLGWKADHLEYYVIRKICNVDYRYIEDEFERSLNSWLIEFSTWFDRKILGIDRVL